MAKSSALPFSVVIFTEHNDSIQGSHTQGINCPVALSSLTPELS
jgi:hypothetical protein